jgi:hypothetical protein
MTLLGRVFTMMVLLLSITFFLVSLLVNSTHTNHKVSLNALKTQTGKLEQTNEELRKQTEVLKTALSQEQMARRTSLSSLQTQLADAKEQLAQANKELTDKAAVLTLQTQQLSETMDRVKLLTSQNDTLKTEIDKIVVDRDAQRRKVISLTDKLHELQSVEADLLAERTKLQNDATLYQAKAETYGAALRSAGITDPDDVPPADLKGEVLTVNNNQLVVVSLGKDDGLREGHTLEVFRGSQYLGRVAIRTVKDDQSIGQILPSYRKGYIQAGDKVAARVN